MDEPPIATSADAETAHKIGRKSVRSRRVEVITHSDRRQTWTLEGSVSDRAICVGRSKAMLPAVRPLPEFGAH
jgi:hypothetical protein